MDLVSGPSVLVLVNLLAALPASAPEESDRAVSKTERLDTVEENIPDREWYPHEIYRQLLVAYEREELAKQVMSIENHACFGQAFLRLPSGRIKSL